jgi:hypothetical protein
MPGHVDVYYSFRNPHSYLATPDKITLQENLDFEVHFRVVLPIAVVVLDHKKMLRDGVTALKQKPLCSVGARDMWSAWAVHKEPKFRICKKPVNRIL